VRVRVAQTVRTVVVVVGGRRVWGMGRDGTCVGRGSCCGSFCRHDLEESGHVVRWDRLGLSRGGTRGAGTWAAGGSSVWCDRSGGPWMGLLLIRRNVCLVIQALTRNRRSFYVVAWLCDSI